MPGTNATNMSQSSTSCGRIIHKDVVVIGNGPSGVSVSMMLAGHVAHVHSSEHPDELLSARLHAAGAEGRALVRLPLGALAAGLEGRATNPAALLLDALQRPHADLGVELPPLLHWRHRPELQIEHVVLGKGPPGGSWHTMDPNILTLSLGSWMSLPGVPYASTEPTDSQRRASAGSVARYYQNYVEQMDLGGFMAAGVHVVAIEPVNRGCAAAAAGPQRADRRKCSLGAALNYIKTRTKYLRGKGKEAAAGRTCKRPRECLKFELSPERRVRDMLDQGLYQRVSRDGIDHAPHAPHAPDDRKTRSSSFSCDSSAPSSSGSPRRRAIDKHNSLSDITVGGDDMEIVCECEREDDADEADERRARWLVHARLVATGARVTYSCRDLVLATGASDTPNRLDLSPDTHRLPWVVHDLRSLERHLDGAGAGADADPVLVVGAGLSAADAIIATRFRSVPVLHVFRNRAAGLDKQLPENMYPEYHKVHQMMVDGGSTYPLYTALPEHSVCDVLPDRTVELVSARGERVRHRVSCVAVLIGARPDLHFLPPDWALGVDRAAAVDAKSNPIHINRLSHSVVGQDGLYAVGPLAGDNFVRFIPGGALAVVADLYRKRGL